jgi:putative IMPACT (imprinted ancient) family translation regulator
LEITPDYFKQSDEGEPANTAGKPILAQIQGHKLNNILIVVTRYFGGTLLGVGGLIQAYGE